MTQSEDIELIQPDWSAPPQVKAFSTTRVGGYSQGDFAGFNLAGHVNDDITHVARNRALLGSVVRLPCEPFWLNQTHSVDIADLDLLGNSVADKAFDAGYSGRLEVPCVVQTADCLPILMCDLQGAWVAAIHAGWRGLLSGVIENTLACYKHSTDNLIAWIGPCIRQKQFAVGAEIRQQFVNKNYQFAPYFELNNHQWFADLPGMATLILSQQQVVVFDSELCSYSDHKQFFSYRRDGATGRMASLIWIE